MDKKKEQIIKSAETLFARFGIRKTTMDEIAQSAHIGKSTLYYYFPSKEEIFAEVIRKDSEYFKTRLDAAIINVSTPQEKIKAYVTTRMTHLKELGNYYTTLTDEYLEQFVFVESARKDFNDYEISTLSSLIKEGNTLGVFQVSNVEVTARNIAIALKGLEYPLLVNSKNVDMKPDKNINIEIIEKWNKKMTLINLKPVKTYHTLKEEIVNSVTHGIGAIFSLFALIVLIIFAVWSGDPWRIASFIIFGVSMFLVYLTSTLYHGITKPRVKQVFRILDHTAIYLLIAGTYTPVILTMMRNPLGWGLLGTVWVMAVAGIIHDVFFFNKMTWLKIPYYVIMAALIFFAIKPLLSMVPVGMIKWLLIGGAFYLLGLIFYGLRKLPYSHAIWHLFVMAGNACHLGGILKFLT